MTQNRQNVMSTQQSQVIDAQFSKILTERQERPNLSSSMKQLRFNKKDLQQIRSDFRKLCSGDRMSYEEFRVSIGLLGSEEFFTRRLFQVIDGNCDYYIDENEYLRYFDTVFNGTLAERSLFGWKMVAGNRHFIELHDMFQLFYEVALLWQAITGEAIQPDISYLEQVFQLFDIDQDQAITFTDYQVLFQEQPFLFGWYEYLNGKPLGENDLLNGFGTTKSALQMKRKSNFRLTDSHEESALKQEQKQILILKRFKGICTTLSQIANESREDSGTKSKMSENRAMSPLEDLSSKLDRTFLSKAYDTAVVLKRESEADKEERLQFSQLFPESARSFRSQQIVSVQSDVEGRMVSQLRQLLQKINILKEACQVLDSERTRRDAEQKREKQLQFKYKFVSQQLAKTESSTTRSVYFGQQSWNLVLNLMIGLRKSVKALHELNYQLELNQVHFSQKHQFLLANRMSKPPHEHYRFCDFAPLAFQRLRRSFGISNESYHRSVGPESTIGKLFIGRLTALSEKCSTGRSGSFFYETHDGKYLLKTIPHKQFLFLKSVLPAYYAHMKKHPDSLIVRICGAYRITRYVGKSADQSIYFINMENAFKTELKITERFDLKGSSYGRNGNQSNELKDNDWTRLNKKISLRSKDKVAFLEQLSADAAFFSRNNINDYSFLIGIAGAPDRQSTNALEDFNVPRFRRFKGGCLSKQEDKVYLFSIIDIFTQFNSNKSAEYVFKRAFLGDGVSCIPPQEYARRFQQFIKDAII